jgi:hypothetical protein
MSKDNPQQQKETMLAPKKPTIVGLMTVTTHTLKTGEVTLENLRQTAEMDGIVSLETEDGEKIILDITDEIEGSNIKTARVIKAAPTLLAKLNPPPVAKN